MTQTYLIFNEEATIASNEQSDERELGKLDFMLKQEVRSSVVPDTTHMRRIVFSNSAAQETTIERNPNKEIDDKFVQWIGRVLEISGDTFTARIDPIHQKTTSKIAKFNVNKVAILNQDQMKEGATFYWTVGLFRNKKGMYVKKSEVRFRFPIIPNKQAVDELAMIEAQKLFDGIGWLE